MSSPFQQSFSNKSPFKPLREAQGVIDPNYPGSKQEFEQKFNSKSPLLQSSITDPTKEGVEQLKDWVNQREATGRFEDQLGNGQKEKGFNNLDNTKKVSEEDFGKIFGEEPIGSGQYSPDDDVYFANSDDTNNHELAHVFDLGTTGAPQQINDRLLTENDVNSGIQKKITSIPIKDYEPNFVLKLFGQEKKSYPLDEYQLNAPEIYGELMKFRFKNKIDPKKIFTKKDIPELRKKLEEESGYGADRNINQHYDDENLLRLFNEVVSVPNDKKQNPWINKYRSV